MKASQFVELLRKVVREEVTTVVRREMKMITEGLTENKVVAKSTPIQKPKPVRTAPLVIFDENDMIGSLLNETANSMANGPDPENIDPEFGVSATDTYALVKDYSQILKKAENISSNR